MSLAASVVMFSCTSEKKQEVKVDEKPLVRLETVKTQEVEQIQEFSLIAGYKINIQKSVAFLYANSEQSEKEIKKAIPFTIATKTKNKI